MKKTAFFLSLLLILALFSGCTDKSSIHEEITEPCSTDDELYESMTAAALNGDFSDAVDYYNEGAAGADKADACDWYFYARAMDEYSSYGCIGRPLDMLLNKASADFYPSKKMASELMALVKDFDGIYECNGSYLYIEDGKIGFSSGAQAIGALLCEAEIAVKNNTFYMVELSSEGTHSYCCEMSLVNGEIVLNAGGDNADDIHEGTYSPFASEMPELFF